MSTTLYRLYDEHRQLLYVGITSNLGRRLGEHNGALWFLDVTRIDVEHFDTRDEAMESEKLAIATERPLFNIQHEIPVPRGTNPGQVTVATAAVTPGLLPIALRPPEAAELLGVSVPTLYRLMKSGEIPYWQAAGGRARLLSRVELERIIAERAGERVA